MPGAGFLPPLGWRTVAGRMIPGLSYHNEPGKTATHPDPATPVRSSLLLDSACRDRRGHATRRDHHPVAHKFSVRTLGAGPGKTLHAHPDTTCRNDEFRVPEGDTSGQRNQHPEKYDCQQPDLAHHRHAPVRAPEINADSFKVSANRTVPLVSFAQGSWQRDMPAYHNGLPVYHRFTVCSETGCGGCSCLRSAPSFGT